MRARCGRARSSAPRPSPASAARIGRGDVGLRHRDAERRQDRRGRISAYSRSAPRRPRRAPRAMIVAHGGVDVGRDLALGREEARRSAASKSGSDWRSVMAIWRSLRPGATGATRRPRRRRDRRAAPRCIRRRAGSRRRRKTPARPMPAGASVGRKRIASSDSTSARLVAGRCPCALADEHAVEMQHAAAAARGSAHAAGLGFPGEAVHRSG